MNLRSVLLLICPPIIIPPLRETRDFVRNLRGPRPARLFDEDDELFIAAVMKSKVYGEYGVGASTKYVLKYTTAQIIAVDTSQEWIGVVRENNENNPRLGTIWIDLGVVEDWGRPLSYAHRDKIVDYLGAIWNHEATPDVVLVDGRFRVACFCYTLLTAKPGTTIIFDDYYSRPRYQVVEEVIHPRERFGRQALFIVPDDVNRAGASTLMEQFLMVMD